MGNDEPHNPQERQKIHEKILTEEEKHSSVIGALPPYCPPSL